MAYPTLPYLRDMPSWLTPYAGSVITAAELPDIESLATLDHFAAGVPVHPALYAITQAIRSHGGVYIWHPLDNATPPSP